MDQKFGDFIRERRIELNHTLRNFCKAKGYDTAYISRLENGFMNPPTSEEKLKGLATALELREGSSEWVTFFDLAAVGNQTFPEDIKNNFSEIAPVLPAFYRTLRTKKMSEKDIKNLIALFKSSNE